MSQRSVNTPSGFQGSIGSLPLVDLLQVWAMNRLSGLVTVTFDGRSGRLYFVEGEIVHADAEGMVGEAAVRVILGWPEGTFELAPNTATLERSIEKSLSHLLLDAHRELDEARRATPAPRPKAPPLPAAAPGEPPRAGVLQQIRAIPGVTHLVRFGSDGRPLGDAGSQAEGLAAKGLYLALTHAAGIASAFGLHDLGIATLQGAREAFVVVHSHGSYLCVAAAPGTAMDPIVAQLRALLARPASR
jgi:hypothetical protein